MTAPFVKRIPLDDGGARFRFERDRARAAAALLAGDREAATPALLDADERTGELRFERISGLEPLTRWTEPSWFERAARTLARIHAGLDLDPAGRSCREADRHRDDLVPVHGDFWFGNLGRAGGRLVVFDWGARPWDEVPISVAPPALDLAGFLAPFLVPRWWDPFLHGRGLRRFLHAYAAAAGPALAASARADLPVELGRQYVYLEGELRRRGALKRLLLRPKTRVNIWRLEHGVRD